LPVIALLIILAKQVVRVLFLEQAIRIKVFGFEKLAVSFIDLLILLLKFVQLLCAHLAPEDASSMLYI
jgi:hypothetical protein